VPASSARAPPLTTNVAMTTAPTNQALRFIAGCVCNAKASFNHGKSLVARLADRLTQSCFMPFCPRRTQVDAESARDACLRVTFVTYTGPMRLGLGATALALLASLACGRLKPAREAHTISFDSGAPEASSAPDVSPAETAPVRTGRPLPDDVQAPVRLQGATAQLVSNGKAACTHQTPASGDGHRWCAFTLGPATNGLADLWVMDVTRAATGDVPVCDGTNAGCLHLTDKVVTRSATFFEGDTLLYGTDSIAGAAADFMGRIFAWRPGWTAGRQISSDAGFTCIGNQHAAAVACLGDPNGDPAKRDSANVSAGYLVDGATGPLPSFGRWPLRNDNDTAWQAGFSPDGSFFVLSDADTIGSKRTLRLSPTAIVGAAAPMLALEDVTSWQISNDGQKIYFVRGNSQHPDLYVADFPSGANPQVLETSIHAFWLVGDRPTDQAVVILKTNGGGGTVELLRDQLLAAPQVLFTYDDFLEGAIVSTDVRYTTWLDEEFRGVVFRNSDLTTCKLDLEGESPIFEPSYLESASLMFWKENVSGSGSLRDAFYAPPEDCRSKRQFAHLVDAVVPVGDRGLVFTDELDTTTMRTTLKYIAAAADGSSLDARGPVRVHENVAQVVFVGAGAPLLVYSAAGPSADTSGLFVFGPVPF
jgi:hypothetical protein